MSNNSKYMIAGAGVIGAIAGFVSGFFIGRPNKQQRDDIKLAQEARDKIEADKKASEAKAS